ncbi:MAG: hypothetical protein AB7O65_13130 [Candidatus Korobacteraceae bacterium]
MTEAQANGTGATQVYVTLHGMPLTVELKWPFFRSQTGADFYILQGTVRLEDGRGLHALVSLQLTMTLKEVLPSLEAKDIEWAVINTLRKAVDTKEIEFVKSPKRIPIQFGSRSWDFRRNRWVFGQATEIEILEFLQRKVFWQTRLEARAEGDAAGSGSKSTRVWVADPADAQYLGASATRIAELAAGLASAGLLNLDGEYASATEKLLAEAEPFQAAMLRAQEELEQKHAFERG